MRKYRKKPVVIDAIKVTKATFSGVHPNPDHIKGLIYNPDTETVTIETLEGTMTARLGDWIIKGVQGEYYPCKPDIFYATYEALPFDII